MADETLILSEILGRHGIGIAGSLQNGLEQPQLPSSASEKFEFIPLLRRQCDDDPDTCGEDNQNQHPDTLRSGWYSILEKLPPLSSQEMVNLAQVFENGRRCAAILRSGEFVAEHEVELRDARDCGFQAFDRMLRFNLRLVRSMAIRYRSYSPDVGIEDTFQSGCFGLVMAIEKWDWQRGYNFSTYATNWIRQSITRDVHNTSGPARLPVHRFEGLYWDYKLKSWVNDAHERIAISPHSDLWPLLEPFSVEQILEFPELDGLVVSDGDLDSFMANEFNLSIVDSVLIHLNERERSVIKCRFGIGVEAPMTLEDIGKAWGLTRERIRQIENTALFKVRIATILEVCRDSLFEDFRKESLDEQDLEFLSFIDGFPNERQLIRYLKKQGSDCEKYSHAMDMALREFAFQNCYFN